MNAVLHYLNHGVREGRNPSPLFDSGWYLAQNPDVRGAGINPLVHYLKHGAAEGRSPSSSSADFPNSCTRSRFREDEIVDEGVLNRIPKLRKGGRSFVDIGVITDGVEERQVAVQPWIYHRDTLLRSGIRIHLYRGGEGGFSRGFDAMLLHVWQDWANRRLFHPERILPILEQYATYRSHYPQTVQIVLNHTDMARRPYATPYWRDGDPVLYRTPAYDRAELAPFAPETIWAYEKVWGANCFLSDSAPVHQAGFIGTDTGPKGYRQRVAAATARIGIGICAPQQSFPKAQYDAVMGSCKIVVCPRGWGENSSRHWDAWLSGKPVLTDRECDSVEMIPGIRLLEGQHYLVFDDPDQIPDIVSDWTRPSRSADLAAIAENGRRAALSYDAVDRITRFFRSIAQGCARASRTSR